MIKGLQKVWPYMKIVAVIKLTSVLFLMAICTSCLDPALPVYEMTKREEDGICVTIDGVKYKQSPPTKWHVQISDNVIGYAGSGKTKIVEAQGDTERNFIILVESGFGDVFSYPLLYRIDLREPSAESISKILCSENDYEKSVQIDNWITDKDIIRELFYALVTGDRSSNIINFKHCGISLACYSDKVSGGSYLLSIVRNENKYMCGNSNEGYVEITEELLKKIIGHEID